jgi:hypothetical protein
MDWVCAQLDVSQANLFTSSAWLIDPIEVLDTFTDPTLMATRAFLAMRTSTTQVTGGGFVGVGIIAWDGTSALSPAEPPGPIDDCDFDWINRWVGIAPDGTTAGAQLNPNLFDNSHLSKARRRLPSGTGLLVCFQAKQMDGPTAIGIDIRCLIKE